MERASSLGRAPQREYWLQPGISHLLVAVCPNVSQEEIAKSNVFDSRLNSRLHVPSMMHS
jgi:hypothetical protein